MPEIKRIASSYMPPELMEFYENWDISFKIENITPSGATIKCTQNGGEATGELQTGSWYILESWTQENGWKEAVYLIQSEVSWTQEDWIIPNDSTSEWKVDWEWLYGKLPEGKYRIGKEIMDFRATGDYDISIYYAEFEIK